MTRIVDDLRLKIDQIEQPSFENPDGAIVRVDNTPPGTVWINLGRVSGLRKGITFSVYTQSHQGVGRKLDDIKAKIEVNESSLASTWPQPASWSSATTGRFMPCRRPDLHAAVVRRPEGAVLVRRDD